MKLINISCPIRFTTRSSFSQQKPIPHVCLVSHATLLHRSSTNVIQSGLNSWILLFVSTGILLSGSLYFRQVSGESDNFDKLRPAGWEDSLPSKEYYGMVASKLPGRPGNLTREQEIKLKELWTEAFKVFGVELPVEHGDVSEKNNTDLALSSAEADKKKKKRMNLFGNRKHAGEGTDESHTGGSKGSGDTDDKFGLTKEFQQTLATMSPEEIREAFWSMVKHDNPDGLLLRFLRARKWDVHKALVMLIATMRWRLKEMQVDDDIIKNGEGAAATASQSSDKAVKREAADFMAQLRLGKSFLRGTDKEGRPICHARVRLHRQGDQSEASLERYTVYIIETARLVLAPDVDTAAVIFDMTDFSLANMDYGPVKFMIKCFEANYPESLGIVLVHKSPWIFQGVWSIIKGWLDPVVASKVHFTKTLAELEHFIDRSHIIGELGGDDPYTYRYIEPSPGENTLLEDAETRNRLQDERAALVREYEKTTQEWIKETTALASLSLSSGGKEKDEKKTEDKNTLLQTKRTDLAQRLRTGYWQLDPYLRAKTLYDRLGVIGEGGKIQFYDSSSPTGTSTSTTAPAPAPAPAKPTSTSHADSDPAQKAAAGAVNSNSKNSAPRQTQTQKATATLGTAAQNSTAAAGAGAGVGHRDHDLD